MSQKLIFTSCRTNITLASKLFFFIRARKKDRTDAFNPTRNLIQLKQRLGITKSLSDFAIQFDRMTDMASPTNSPSSSVNEYQDTFLCTSEFDSTGFYEPTYYLLAHRKLGGIPFHLFPGYITLKPPVSGNPPSTLPDDS